MITDDIHIYYDDDQLKVIEKINILLQSHGLQLVDDNLPHDGYCVVTLVKND